MQKNLNSDILNILRRINSNPNASQRQLASDLNLSLGKLNYVLKALRAKGLIKIQNFNRQKNKIKYIQYILTAKGIAKRTSLTINFMKKKIKEFEKLKKELNEQIEK